MTKDLAYYQTLPYDREWLPRDDESGRYFVVRLKDVPGIYGMGHTRQKALAQFRTAFDDQVAWYLEEGLPIPEPSVIFSTRPKTTVQVVVEKIEAASTAEWSQLGKEGASQTQSATASYHNSEPIDAGQTVAA